MSISKENLNLVLGLKVGWLRQQKQLSLKELSEKCGLSISYLNEIEKGKKYPKADKIMALSHALDIAYDDLVSLQLDQQLAPLSNMLSTSIMQEIPFDIFGLNKSQVMELMTNKPAQFSSLVDTLVKMAHANNIGVDDILLGALKSYREMNADYFPEIERAASDFRKHTKWDDSGDAFLQIKAHLSKNLNYRIDETMLAGHAYLNRFRSLSFPKKPPIIYVNNQLGVEQQSFALLREAGYEFMGFAERVSGASVLMDATFDQLLNSAKASYFAGAVLIPETEFVKDLKEWFSNETCNIGFLDQLMVKYTVTPEMLFHRLVQVLKTHFDIGQFYFTRTQREVDTRSHQITSDLHFGRIHPTHGIGNAQHYCRRWVSSKLLGELSADTDNEVELGLQKSVFHQTGETYFCIAAARKLRLSNAYSCVTIGFLENDTFRKKVRFHDDVSVKRVEVNRNCEHCSIQDCTERVAPATQWKKYLDNDRIKQALDELYAKS